MRQVVKDGGRYFGPFPDAYAVNDAIDLFHLYYPFRTCNLNFDKGARLDRPCLNYFIHKCKGPCVDKEDEKIYLNHIDDVVKFLENKSEKIPNWVLAKMDDASKDLNFEMAAKYRDYYRALSVISERQNVTETGGDDLDIIAMSKGMNSIIIQVFFMRMGKIVDREHFIIKNDFMETDSDIMSSFIKQFYLDIMYVPKEILVQYMPDDLDSISEFLSRKKKSKVYIHNPKLGKKKRTCRYGKP